MSQEFIGRKIINIMKLCQAEIAHIPWNYLDKKIVAECHRNKIKVHSHIYKYSLKRQKVIYRKMTALGIDQCTFDDILLLEKI